MVNYIAVLLCGIASMVIGSLWYSPKVFGNEWMKLVGISQKDIEAKKADMPKIYGIMFIASLIMAYVLALFAYNAGPLTITTGIMTGFWAWLGFVATVMLTGMLFGDMKMRLYVIQAGYQLVTLLVMGAIIGIVK